MNLQQNRSPRQLTVAVSAVPVPTAGWDAMSPLANMAPDNAVTLENWFPQPGWIELRRGFSLHSSVDGPTVTDPVETLMTWQGPGAADVAMFAGMDASLWDVTTEAQGVEVAAVGPFTNVRFQYTNFTTSGGNYLWACNGAEDPVFYDGSVWADTAITGVTPGDIVDVCAHRSRLWLALKDSLTAAYLPLDSIQGAAVTFELGGLFEQGGFLQSIGTWSKDGGDGPDDLLVFVTSRGQVAVYSMVDPTDPDGFFLVGVYSIGTPLGRRCLEMIGPDLAVITNDGVQSLGQVISLDRAAQERGTITARVQPAINRAARITSSSFGWQFISYPKGTYALLNVPIGGGLFQQYVMNTLTGAWGLFTGQNAYCWALKGNDLFFGGDGLVLHADDAGGDFGGEEFVAALRTAFSYYGNRGRKKRWPMVQPIIDTNAVVIPSIDLDVDFRLDDGNEADPLPIEPASGALWGSAVWGVDSWGGSSTVFDDWVSTEAIGYAAAVHLLVAVAGQPLGQELVTNADFAAWTTGDPDGWTETGEAGGNSITDDAPGALFVSADGALLSLEQTVATMTAGTQYYISVTCSSVVAGGFAFGTKADVGSTITTAGTHTRTVLASAGDGLKVYIRNATSTISTFTITDVSVRELFNDVANPTNDTSIVLRLNALNVTHETGQII
jgi:hypothetical protein